MSQSPLLEVKNLVKHFRMGGGFLSGKAKVLQAVRSVSFELYPGETLGIVGESGCGKSTLGRSVLQLHRPTSGSVKLKGEELTKISDQDLRAYRKRMQIIFQDPYASLNPRMSVYETLKEPLRAHGICKTKEEYKSKIEELVVRVGLKVADLAKYPHEFSGGQRQRIGIARALCLDPEFIVADEPVSALDVSIQSQILNLIADIQKETGISFLFIAHDLAVVQHVSHRVAVMYLGKIVELASSKDLFEAPKHPYTKLLLSAVPQVDHATRPRQLANTAEVDNGVLPSPLKPPVGCAFHPRCPLATDKCRQVDPVLENHGGRSLACHHVDLKTQ